MNSTNRSLQVIAELEPLLDEKEAARFLGVAESTPGSWRRANPAVGPAFVVVERHIRYQPADLRAYVAFKRRDSGVKGK